MQQKKKKIFFNTDLYKDKKQSSFMKYNFYYPSLGVELNRINSRFY